MKRFSHRTQHPCVLNTGKLCALWSVAVEMPGGVFFRKTKKRKTPKVGLFTLQSAEIAVAAMRRNLSAGMALALLVFLLVLPEVGAAVFARGLRGRTTPDAIAWDKHTGSYKTGG